MSDTPVPPVTGGCHCGAIRFEAHVAPTLARACWCRFCQKIGAGGATVNAFFPSDQVTIEGDMTVYRRAADSGNEVMSGFCPACGTDITTAATIRPHIIGIRLGAFDDPETIAPSSTIWTDAAPRWAAIDRTAPCEARQPPPMG